MGQQLSSTAARLSEDPWYRPDLMTKDYEQYGDAYNDNIYEKLCKGWNEDYEAATCVNPHGGLRMGREGIC
jgi:hypothetical protein